MRYEILMPKLGWAMEEGEMVEWLVQEGDSIKEGQPVFVLLTEKATVEVESTVTGKLLEIVAQDGDTIQVGEVIAVVEIPD